jgi:hypothetical protein
MSGRITALLGLACAAQAAVLAMALLRPAPDLAPRADDPTLTVPKLPPMAPLAEFGETTARPLFLATRLTAPDAGPVASNGKHLILGRYAFVGAVAAPGRSVVLLAPASGGPTLRLREGEALDGWTVREIGADFLRLEREGEESLVPLVKN